MLKTKTMPLNKKVWLISLPVLFIVMLLLLFAVGIKTFNNTKASHQDMLQKGIEQTIASKSFYYRSTTKISVTGQENHNYISEIEGCKAAPDRIKITGTIMDTPIEFIQTGNKAFLKDTSSGHWISLSNSNFSDMEILYAELNPLIYFKFDGIAEFKYIGKKRIGGEKMLLMEVRPHVSDSLLGQRLTDFYYKLWLHPDDLRIQRALLMAVSKENTQLVTEIDLTFWDFDKDMSIEPPDIS